MVHTPRKFCFGSCGYNPANLNLQFRGRPLLPILRAFCSFLFPEFRWPQIADMTETDGRTSLGENLM